MFKRILIPVDTSEIEPSKPAIATGADLARTGGADVRIVHVRYMMEGAIEYLPPDFFEDEEKRSIQQLEALAAGMNLPSGRISTRSLLGSIYDQVLAAATEFNADLIVMGSHRPSMSTYLIGSNAARIVRHAKCSVLVVRQP